jgi:hypothetical protein
MSGLAILLLFDARGEAPARAPALMAAALAAAEPGEAVITVASGTEPGTGFALRLARETTAPPPQVALRLIELPGASGLRGSDPDPRRGAAEAAGLSAFVALNRDEIEYLVTVDGRAEPALIGRAIAQIRQRLVASGAAVLALTPATGPTPVRALQVPPVLRRFVLRRDLVLAAQAAEPGDPGLVLEALALAESSAVLRLPDAVLPPLPEAGAGLVAAIAALPGARRDTGRDGLAALLQGLAPGWLERAGLPPEDAPAAPAAPAVTGRARLALWIEGRHRHRTPLSYRALAPLWQETARFARDPGEADLIVWAHPADPVEMPEETARAIAARPRPLVLMSEEPFWDSLFSPDPAAAAVTLPAGHLGELRLHQVNHSRSWLHGGIFDFDHLPYYLLTEHRFASAYARRFARTAALSAADWEESFKTRPIETLFLAERREEAFHDIVLPEAGITGLCAWRTRLALARSDATRHGASWGTGPDRRALPDWHLDKLTRYDRTVRLMSGVENTRQPLYVSEKLFDAFACGARPLYVAGEGHGVARLGLPEGAFVDLAGLDPAQAAEALDDLGWNRAFFEAYAAAQGRLAALFAEPGPVLAERARLGAALGQELMRLADLGLAR